MEKLRVAFTDFWPEWPDEDFITPILEKHFEVVIDRKNPDVVFHSIFNRMSETPRYKCKKILFLGENWRPGYFGSDYSISFDPHSETNYRLPLWQAFILKNPGYWDRLVNKKRHENFERFCAFVVSNPSNNVRNNTFDELRTYKTVHSYGKVRTNTFELKRASEGRYWRDAKDEFFLNKPHKFMFAFENTAYPWYCTEKLMDAFLVGSVPIYWGDPKVGEDWNSGAFINAMKLGKDGIGTVKKLDQNPSLFGAVYSDPVFTEEQKEKHLDNMKGLEEWVINKIY